MIENFMHLQLKENTDCCCPVCGDMITVPFEPEHCYHTLFIYDNNKEEFVYVPEDNQEIINKSIKEADQRYSALECAIGYLKNTPVIFFEVTFSGSDWGPDPVVLTFGFDLRD